MDISLETALEMAQRHKPRRRESAATGIYDDLRQRILSLELPPGTSLLRNELAKSYDVSVTPLRDALRQLQQDGLVKSYPQSRTVVTPIDEPLIHKAHFLRRGLETEVVRQLARTPGPATVSRGRSLIKLQKTVARDREQLRLFQELDEDFHRFLFKELDLLSLHDLIRTTSGHLDRVRRLQRHSQAKKAHIIAGHEAIIDAVEARDEAAAMRAIRDHLRKPADWVDEFRAEHPDYFA